MIPLCNCEKLISNYSYICSDCYFTLIDKTVDGIFSHIFSGDNKTFEELKSVYNSNPKEFVSLVSEKLRNETQEFIEGVISDNLEFYQWKQNNKKGSHDK